MIGKGVVAVDIDVLLNKWQTGDRTAESELFSYCYDAFKQIARNVRNHHIKNKSKTYQHFVNVSHETTVLVHDAFIRVAGARSIAPKTKSEFFKKYAQVIYSILIDEIRKQKSLKRSGIETREELFVEDQEELERFLDLQSELTTLNHFYERQVSAFLLKYACRLTNKDIAQILSISQSSVDKDILFVKQSLSSKLAS